ncbi:DnaJ domain-containing protein [Pseudenhygromyxa sp. WMMC2535]|uniref:DnaJ domain-containing protein n=1 Tax=Pseudenhygromyxa sp. WMMC2535 TaxID=2712867 RepID=UPI00155367CA|nr:DnaJ domain-containing protein [Pseudenhygromyxa sp. WMMC2535]
MGIGKRFWDVTRSNLTDFASAFSTDPEERERRRLDKEFDEELRREVDDSVGARAGRRAREAKDRAEEAWERAFEEARQGGGPVRGARPSGRQLDEWYRTLEIPSGADLKTVRKSYRKLVAKYHPDRYASDPEKYAAATEVARKITAAYEGLKIHLGAA